MIAANARALEARRRLTFPSGRQPEVLFEHDLFGKPLRTLR